MNPLLIFPLFLQIMITKSETDFPDYYKISYENMESPTYQGFYQKQEKELNRKPVFQMPRMSNTLYFDEDRKWTLGYKYTRNNQYKDKLFMLDAGHDVPKSGDWIVQTDSGKSETIDVTVTTYTPEYPAYYEVRMPEATYLDGFYRRMPGDQNLKNFPIFKKKTIEGVPEYVLFLHTDGGWQINYLTNSAKGFAISSPKGLPTPDLSKDWEVWNKHKNVYETSNNFKLLTINPVYPESYNVSYSGQDQEMIDKLQIVLGNYTKQESAQDDIPTYTKLKTGESLFLSPTGKWILQNSYSTIYQEANGSPTVLLNKPWKLSDTKDTVVGFSVTQNDESRRSKKLEVDTVPDDKTNLVLILGIVGAVSIPTIFVIIAVCVYRKCGNKVDREEPKIDDNFYYGEDYDENDTDNAITDTNDYYD